MWPGPSGVLYSYLRGRHRKAIQEEPRWKRAKPRVLELPSDVASAPTDGRSRCPSHRVPQLRVQRLWTCMTVLAFSLS